MKKYFVFTVYLLFAITCIPTGTFLVYMPIAKQCILECASCVGIGVMLIALPFVVYMALRLLLCDKEKTGCKKVLKVAKVGV
jgi:predicted ferric reductase